jgi:hypothetical protein
MQRRSDNAARGFLKTSQADALQVARHFRVDGARAQCIPVQDLHENIQWYFGHERWGRLINSKGLRPSCRGQPRE